MIRKALDSDLPGTIIAQVTENVRDSATGEGATAALTIREYLENHEKISHTVVATLYG